MPDADFLRECAREYEDSAYACDTPLLRGFHAARLEKAKRLRELAARSPAPSDERDGLAVLKVQTPTTGMNAVFGKMPSLPFPEDPAGFVDELLIADRLRAAPILEEREAEPPMEHLTRLLWAMPSWAPLPEVDRNAAHAKFAIQWWFEDRWAFIAEVYDTGKVVWAGDHGSGSQPTADAALPHLVKALADIFNVPRPRDVPHFVTGMTATIVRSARPLEDPEEKQEKDR